MGRTENVKNCLDPKFSRSFKVNYLFEEVQKIKIAVYDLDNDTPQLTDDDFLGQLECTLGQLVSNSPYTKALLLNNGKKAGNGSITVRSEEMKEGGEVAYLTFRGKHLDKKDFLGKSDPYLEILKSTTDRSWQVIHRTEVIKNTLNPSWRPFQIPVHTLCGDDKTREIRFDVYDWDNDGGHDYIGGMTTTLTEMTKANNQEYSWPLINPKKKAKKKSYSNSGVCLLTSFKVMKEHTFLEFIFGGMQINFTVGIDFTASNGNPQNQTSLHYINPYQPNEYMQAIQAVGNVCQDYDTDKLFPALGFGAKIPPAMSVSHEFAVNFNMQNPFCQGIDGVLQAYTNCIRQVQLYGPTNVAPIVRHVARFAAAAQKEEPSKGAHAYYILLLLTDGVLSDMSDTKQAIVEASRLPMSLIIVGVGTADFSMMEELDGDDGVLRGPSGQPVARDIVQFVPYREFKQSSQVELARHVLAEVPQQVTGYYKMRGIKPSPPVKSRPPVETPPSEQPPAKQALPQGGSQPSDQPGSHAAYPGQMQNPAQASPNKQTPSTQSPYPGQAPYSQQAPQGQMQYSNQAPTVQPPYPDQGQAQRSQAPYPSQAPAGQFPPYPNKDQASKGQAPYPSQAPSGQLPPYPNQGQASQGQAPYPNQAPGGQFPPYPNQGQASQGQALYPNQAPGGQFPPYPNQGQASQGQAPYPNQAPGGQFPPYPNQGQASQGQAPGGQFPPYPNQGQIPHRGPTGQDAHSGPPKRPSKGPRE